MNETLHSCKNGGVSGCADSPPHGTVSSPFGLSLSFTEVSNQKTAETGIEPRETPTGEGKEETRKESETRREEKTNRFRRK